LYVLWGAKEYQSSKGHASNPPSALCSKINYQILILIIFYYLPHLMNTKYDEFSETLFLPMYLKY